MRPEARAALLVLGLHASPGAAQEHVSCAECAVAAVETMASSKDGYTTYRLNVALGGVATPATSQFATEVHKYVEEKGERLVGERSEGSDPLIALTDQLESVVNVEGVRGLFVPFAVPQQMEEVRPSAPRALAAYAGAPPETS